MKKKPLLIAGVSLMAFLASACNTMAGMGEDVEAAGSEVEETAEETKGY